MNSSQIREWLEVVGVFGVIASLVFVGLQMKQDRLIAQATLYQMRSDSVRELMALQMEYSNLPGLAEQSVDSLDPDELRRMTSGIMAHFSHFENTHNIYQLGLLSEEQWVSDVPIICESFEAPAVRAHWQRWKTTYRASFVEEIERLCGDTLER